MLTPEQALTKSRMIAGLDISLQSPAMVVLDRGPSTPQKTAVPTIAGLSHRRELHYVHSV